MSRLGRPRLHLRETTSTNEVARRLAAQGAPHGTLVSADVQTAGRGRQGRSWIAPAGRAVLCSVVVRAPDGLLALRGGLAVADVAGERARVKWPNDVLLDGRKVAGVLAEGRPQEGWAVLGLGVNVAVDPAELPEELRARAGTLGRPVADLEPVLAELLRALARRLGEPATETAGELRRRDALDGARVAWANGEGTGAGIDAQGRLLVHDAAGRTTALDSGEVHLL